MVGRRHRRAMQRGFSLIELMIAITIAVLLGIGMVQVFSAQRIAFAANEALARVQENSRFALQFLERDLRMAGNMTCLNDLGFRSRLYNHLSPDVPVNAPWLYRVDQALQVYEFIDTAPGSDYAMSEPRVAPGAAAWDPPLPPELGIEGVALDGSDVVVMRFMSAEHTVLTGIGLQATVGTITVADPSFVKPGAIYAITDCRNFSLFQAHGGSSVGEGGLNLVGWSGHESAYGPDVPMYRYRFAAYYVAMGAEDGPALFRRSLDDNGDLVSEEMVGGVESLQAVLGADTGLRDRGDRPTQYLTATDVSNGGPAWPASSLGDDRWSSVVTVRLGFLLRNQGRAGVTPPAIPLHVADTRMSVPEDGRLRHVYESQVALRNRIRG